MTPYPFQRGKQHDKIVQMCADGAFKCQALFWEISKSPHKRRGEIEDALKVRFETRKCEHGIKNAFDYKMTGYIAAPVFRMEIVEREDGSRVAMGVRIEN